MADFPYMLTPKSIRPFFNHIQGAGVPQKLTQQYLQATGFKTKSDRALIGILKFIGFIDGGGTPSDLWKKFRSKATGGAVLAAALRDSYKSLFETYNDANERPNNIIQDFISGHSTAGGRVLSAMVGTFKALCSAADFSATLSRGSATSKSEENVEEEEDDEVGQEEPASKRRQQRLESKHGVSVTINVQLVVPATDDPAIYDSFFEAMKRHLIQSDE